MIASIGKIRSSAHGVAYYERDGQRAPSDPDHGRASAWAGSGAAALGLRGPVEPAAFRAALEGRVPGQPQLGRRDRQGNVVHRPGRDLTLSAPKSVSLLALVGGDERIVAAHDSAARTALEWVERNAVETRLRDPATGAMVRAGGQGIVAATFRHDLSRNLDPQLHTHCVIANMARCPSGKWRTMVNDGLYHSKAAIGAIYRADLARGLRGLGYRLERTHADGRFEIAGVPRDVMRAFSTRRQEIEAALAASGSAGSGARRGGAVLAAVATRAGKPGQPPGEPRRAWSQRARELGFAPAGIVAEARASTDGGRPRSGEAAAEAVAWAARALGERDIAFSHAALLVAALGREPGAVTVAEADTAVAGMRGDGRLHLAAGFRPGPHWTCDPAVAAESESIAWMRAGLAAARPLLRKGRVRALLRGSGLCRKSAEAVALALSSPDRVVGLLGFEGPGTARMLDRLRDLAASAACRVGGLAPSEPEARALQRASGIESEPLSRFLARHTPVGTGRVSAGARRALQSFFGSLVQVVDGASLLSTAHMRDLLRIASAQGVARLVLLGDGRWCGQREPGRPFAQLLRAGMPAVTMNERDRRREAARRKAARSRLASVARAAFAKLGRHVSEAPAGRLAAATAALWLALPPARRAAAEVIAHTAALRREIGAAIRDGLVREGVVRGPAWQGERLAPLALGSALLADPASYRPGDTVVFRRAYKRLGVREGAERTVTEVDPGSGLVRLADARGRIADWRPGALAALSGGVELFRNEPLELRAGDRVRWTRDEPAPAGLRAGRLARVGAVRGNCVLLRLEGGTALTLASSDPGLRHLERAWACAPGSPQAVAARHVIAAVETGDPLLATEESLYAALGRVRRTARLVTDDATRLADLLEAATGERFARLPRGGGEPAGRSPINRPWVPG